MSWLSFFIGMLVGWLVELVVDVLFWRRRYQGSASEARLRIEMAGMEAQFSQLEAQLIDCQEARVQSGAQKDAVRTCDAALERANAQVAAMEREVASLHSALSAAEAQVQSMQVAPTGIAVDVLECAAPPVVVPVEPDNLSKIEGIGPKISDLLVEQGIRTFSELAEVEVACLQAILAEAGPRYRLADPSSWPEQARFAAAGDWDALTALQNDLKGGRHTPL